ncbi:MAG: cysteine--tRNA ligase [Nitrososphaera sp.]
MKIFDTLSQKEKEVVKNNMVRIYLCGVTVYDDSHIGHARTIIVFDTLRRFLESEGTKVKFVQNFTDIDDKIINRARTENTSADKISTRYIDRYFVEFDKLNVKRADSYPKATEYIEKMIDLIKGLIDKEIAYVSNNGVYFAVSKFKDYGKLSKKKIDELIAGARVEVDETKHDPLDFALWKFANDQPNWDSPWGKGRPGWHIECSAMSLEELGNDFEIHGGGRDLIFPHHENEIAQSEAFTGQNFAKIWMHVGMVTIDGVKMSKSLGNTKTVEYVLQKWGPNIIRLFCLAGHYSKPIDYSEDMLKETITKWRQVENAYAEISNPEKDDTVLLQHPNIMEKAIRPRIEEELNRFHDALNNDFNTSLALNSFFSVVDEINNLASAEYIAKSVAGYLLPVFTKMMNILGLKISEITKEENDEIGKMIERRKIFRDEKRYQDADNIRKQLLDKGIILIDHKKRTLWMKQENIGN